MHSNLFKYSCSTLLMVHHLAKVVRAASATECHSQTCHPIDEYCSQFEQTCMPCSSACDSQDLKYEPSVCSRECSDFIKLQPLKNEIHQIQMQQNIIIVLLIALLIVTAGHFTWKFIKWSKHKRCIDQLMKKLKLKKENASSTAAAMSNGKDLGGTTITNMCAINDIERAPSQIYSLTGVEGSVRTVTTPISSRHPAENATPSPQPNEYSYDNQGLVVTPVSEKPGGGTGFS